MYSWICLFRVKANNNVKKVWWKMISFLFFFTWVMAQLAIIVWRLFLSFFLFFLLHMVFHLNSTCIIPFLESIKWYFSLIRPLYTTSSRLTSTCPNGSCGKRTNQKFDYKLACFKIECMMNMKGFFITYLWSETKACSLTYNLYVNLFRNWRLIKQKLELFIPQWISTSLNDLMRKTITLRAIINRNL